MTISQQFKVLSRRAKHCLRRVIVVMAACCAGLAPAGAAQIVYSQVHLADNRWQLNFTVTAGSAEHIGEFSIFFTPAWYANLALDAAPAGWDVIAVQPDAALPADGYLDGLALAGGLANATLGGFALSFDYLGAGAPAGQRFEIVDPVTFATISSGMTQPISSVPEPGSAAMLAGGLALLMAASRRAQRRQS